MPLLHVSQVISKSDIWHPTVQRIDGFLAVLSVTGGSFSPRSQKLPFAVSSVDGDSYLLYYASIDLAGKFSSNKCRGQNLKRVIDSDDSQSAKSRLRIPVKGRIQLVSIFRSIHFHYIVTTILTDYMYIYIFMQYACFLV